MYVVLVVTGNSHRPRTIRVPTPLIASLLPYDPVSERPEQATHFPELHRDTIVAFSCHGSALVDYILAPKRSRIFDRKGMTAAS